MTNGTKDDLSRAIDDLGARIARERANFEAKGFSRSDVDARFRDLTARHDALRDRLGREKDLSHDFIEGLRMDAETLGSTLERWINDIESEFNKPAPGGHRLG